MPPWGSAERYGGPSREEPARTRAGRRGRLPDGGRRDRRCWAARADDAAADTVDAQVNYASRIAENALTQTFERIRTIDLMLAREPVVRRVRRRPAADADQARRQDRSSLDEVNVALRYLATLLPGQLDSAGFADLNGNEIARYEQRPRRAAGLARQRQDAALLRAGADPRRRTRSTARAPYLSDQSGAWVVTDSTVVVDPAARRSASSRSRSPWTACAPRSSAPSDDGQTVRVVDPGTGLVVMDSRVAQDALMKGGVTHPVWPTTTTS